MIDAGGVGQQGPIGPQGSTGPRGVQGAKGLRGVAGTQGPLAVQGYVGANGVNVDHKGPMVFKVFLEIKVMVVNEVNVVKEEKKACKVILQMSRCSDVQMFRCSWAYGVVVSMFDFHRSDRGSNPGRGGKIK